MLHKGRDKRNEVRVVLLGQICLPSHRTRMDFEPNPKPYSCIRRHYSKRKFMTGKIDRSLLQGESFEKSSIVLVGGSSNFSQSVYFRA
jgi:hypothetical protein